MVVPMSRDERIFVFTVFSPFILWLAVVLGEWVRR